MEKKELFEKFTQNAVEVVVDSQIGAISFHHKKIYPEHLLLGFLKQPSSYSSKVLKQANINYPDLKLAICSKLVSKQQNKKVEYIKFSILTKNILKQALKYAENLSESYVKPDHIFLALLTSKKNQIEDILSGFDFDIEKHKRTLIQILKKKPKNRIIHPEGQQKDKVESLYPSFNSIFDNAQISEVLKKAVAKLSTSDYEILGTEQIILSILEDKNDKLIEDLESLGLDAEKFNQKLSEVTSRKEEFEKKQIIFTPNALKVMIMALDTAKELGDSKIRPEHIILGLLNTKKGIAYKIIEELNIDKESIKNIILKPIEKQMNETFTILKLAKQEAMTYGQNIVGSELLLIGILAEGTTISAKVLRDLGVNIKDTRSEVEKLIGSNNHYISEEKLELSTRAKNILERGYENAKKRDCDKIRSEDILLAIIEEPNCIAMKVLNNLGVDGLEIRQGIINRQNIENRIGRK